MESGLPTTLYEIGGPQVSDERPLIVTISQLLRCDCISQ